MVQSMTAYARHAIQETWGSAVWELRSVNHRYLEVSTKLPEQFRHLEMIVKEKLRARLSRGKIDCSLNITLNQQSDSELQFNHSLALQLLHTAQLLQQDSPQSIINTVDILRWPGVMQSQQQDLDSIANEILQSLEGALTDFIKVRETEGEQLKQILRQRLQETQQEVQAVRQQMPQVLLWQRERLNHRFQEAQLVLDEMRLEQELLLLAQKTDVAEELDRLDVHVKETLHILERSDAIGRRLDFMMQEFNRETNTLASKSINSDITNHAIQMKVLIEQMREQIQNIE